MTISIKKIIFYRRRNKWNFHTELTAIFTLSVVSETLYRQSWILISGFNVEKINFANFFSVSCHYYFLERFTFLLFYLFFLYFCFFLLCWFLAMISHGNKFHNQKALKPILLQLEIDSGYYSPFSFFTLIAWIATILFL